MRYEQKIYIYIQLHEIGAFKKKTQKKKKNFRSVVEKLIDEFFISIDLSSIWSRKKKKKSWKTKREKKACTRKLKVYVIRRYRRERRGGEGIRGCYSEAGTCTYIHCLWKSKVRKMKRIVRVKRGGAQYATRWLAIALVN